VLQHPALADLGLATDFLTPLVRDAIAHLRADPPPTREAALDLLVARVTRAAAVLDLSPRQYINATGIVIHTQWGNAPLARTAQERLLSATGASPTGARALGDRSAICERLLVALTDAEAATVTTQNAASCLLVGAALGHGRELVCAARDLVEISHGARLRDLLEACGARVVPVGAANCVYPDDYRRAISPTTAAIVRIHAANTTTTGYTAHVDTTALAEVARAASIPLVVNLGSGSLVDLQDKDLPAAPVIRDVLRDGADLVLASGDKLIGGPQAGIIAGRRTLVERLARHPVARSCRPGKLTLAALEATLATYVRGRAWTEIAVLRLLAASVDDLRVRAHVIATQVRTGNLVVSVREDTTECGGAALPGRVLPTWTLRLTHLLLGCDTVHYALFNRGILTRRRDNSVVVDLRSVLPEDDAVLITMLRGLAGSAGNGQHAERAS